MFLQLFYIEMSFSYLKISYLQIHFSETIKYLSKKSKKVIKHNGE